MVHKNLIHRVRLGPNLDGNHGVTMTSFVILAIPFMLMMLVIVGDGMSAVATYRRALGLATIGIQAGAASVDFAGQAPALNANACAMAREAICANVACIPTTVSCNTTGNLLNITVRLESPSFIGQSYRVGPAMTTVTAFVADV